MRTVVGYVIVEHNQSTGRLDLPAHTVLYEYPAVAQTDADKERDRAAGEGKPWIAHHVASVVVEDL